MGGGRRGKKKESSSFLKEEPEDFYPKDKSFLFLFFKKEILPSFGFSQ
jgi:hypothetical protein